MLTEKDKQIIIDAAGTIESGLIRVAEAIPNIPEPIDLAQQVYEHGTHITTALEHIATALEHIAEAISDK